VAPRKKSGGRAPREASRRRPSVPLTSARGLLPAEVAEGLAPADVRALQAAIADDGGRVLAAYRDPLGARWQVLAALPLEQVAPTPFQRALSPAHAARLADVIAKLDRFLDPVIAVRVGPRRYWTPNGLHRLEAMRRLGARSLTALVLPEPRAAYRILALNTEKAHNLREKALETVRMARELARLEPRPEVDYALELEEPALLTLGLAYEARPRFSGSPYHPLLARAERFLDAPLDQALAAHARRSEALLALDAAVSEAVHRLEARGMKSPYLKTFVVGRLNPFGRSRGHGDGAPAEVEALLTAMTARAEAFDARKISSAQLERGGPPAEDA
jgi:ParB family chromosome partitioning protein